MDNHEENYVLVLEDRSQVSKPDEVGKLSVVSGQDKDGKVHTVEPKDIHEASFLKFKKGDSMVSTFLKNLVSQFKDPSHIGIYRLVADKVEDSVVSLRGMLSDRENPTNKAALEQMRLSLDEFAPRQKLPPIAENMVDWQSLKELGIDKEKLLQNNNLEKLLNYQKTGLVTLTIQAGNLTLYPEARLALRTDERGNLGLSIHTVRKNPQLDFPYMGQTFSEEDKKALLSTGNLGRLAELTPKTGEPFKAFVSIDALTNELVALRADRVQIPDEIKGVRLNKSQHEALSQGKPVYLEGMTSQSGKLFNATVQVNAENKGIRFNFDNNRTQSQRTGNQYKQGEVPQSVCKVNLTERQRKALEVGKTLYIRNMTNSKGEVFNSFIRFDKESGRIRYSSQDPNKAQEQKQEAPKQTEKRSRGRKI